MFSFFLSTALSFAVIPDQPVGTQLTLPIAATDVQVRLTVPAWTEDTERLQIMRTAGGEHVLAAGTFGTDPRVTIMGGPAPDMDGEHCRQAILGERLLGMGTSTVAGFATAQTAHYLNPPYREIDRHAFLMGVNAMVHLQVIALEKDDPELFGDAGFEAVLNSTRFAVVRRTSWDDLPERYLELSNTASRRVDGAAWLREQASAPDADWITQLVAFEHALAERSTEPFVLELGRAVRAAVSAKTERTRAEDVALLLAEDGIGLTLLRAGDLAAAEPHLLAAVALAPQFGPRTVASVATSIACLRAAQKNADAVVTLLTDAYAVDPALRYRLQREELLDPVRADPRVTELLKVVLKLGGNRQIGR